MGSLSNADLIREIAERVDDGRRVRLVSMAEELNVDFMDLWDAYRQLVEQRGSNPLIDRIYRRLEAARQAGARHR